MSVAKKVLVVQGGPSSEAAVSRTSAASVATALTEAGFSVVRVELDTALPDAIRRENPAVIFPVTHGAVGEDGALQGLLEVYGVPYVGSAVRASANAMDKATARQLFALAGLPCARGVELRPEGRGTVDPAAVLAALGSDVVVKPAESGSALGIERLLGTDAAALGEALARAFSLGAAVVVEQFVRGEETTCGVLHVDDQAIALPPTLIETPTDAFYSYEARYQAGRSVHHCPPPYAPAVVARLQEIAVLAHKMLGCRDLSRADFLVGDRQDPASIVLLEVNTLPGFTGTSLFPEAAAVAGISFPALCTRLVESALRRGATARQEARPMP